MHTNTTEHYNLPQYVGSDIINPLTDTNGAYADIDAAIYAVASAQGTVDSDVENLKSRMTVAETEIDALQEQNGSQPLITTAQTITGAVNELVGSVGDVATATGANTTNINTLTTKVAGLETQCGNAVLHTTAQTLSSAINELDSDITDIKSQNGSEVLVTTAQTLSGAINELAQSSSTPTAASTSYDNSSSHLISTNVQAAIDEVNGKVGTNASNITSLGNDLAAVDGETASGTLAAGATSVTLSFTKVTIGANTLIDPYTSVVGVNPTAITTTANSVTLTFEAQSSAVGVKVHARN